MHRLLSTLVSLAWALWFGGMVMLFVAVMSLFTNPRLDRTTAGLAAADIFRRFESYQLALAAAALLATFAWWLLGARKLKTWLFALFALATLGAAGVTLIISPRMATLHAQEETETDQFRQLHKTAERIYTAQAAVLLVAGLLLPSAVRADGDATRATASASGKAGSNGAGGNGDEPGGDEPPLRQPVGSGSAAENS